MRHSTATSLGEAEVARSLAIVIPIKDEAAAIPELRRRVTAVVDHLEAVDAGVGVVVVDDGSTDGSARLLRAWADADPRVEVLALSRNFGHQAALLAGLDHTTADVVVTMDGDLQDPPELILDMLEKHRCGWDVVSARRRSRPGESWFKRVTAAAFYRLFERACGFPIARDVGDFRLVSRRVIQALRRWPEPRRVMRASVAYLGFPETIVEFDRPARSVGHTKYGLRSMLRLAVDAFFAHSAVPTRLPFLVGAIGAIALVAAQLVLAVLGSSSTLGALWTPLVALVCILALASMSEYLLRIHAALARRPTYVVRAAYRAAHAQAAEHRVGLRVDHVDVT